MKCNNIIIKDKSSAGSDWPFDGCFCFFFITENTLSVHYYFLVEADIGLGRRGYHLGLGRAQAAVLWFLIHTGYELSNQQLCRAQFEQACVCSQKAV